MLEVRGKVHALERRIEKRLRRQSSAGSSGKRTWRKLRQPRKAPSPISARPSGSATRCRRGMFANARSQMASQPVATSYSTRFGSMALTTTRGRLLVRVQHAMPVEPERPTVLDDERRIVTAAAHVRSAHAIAGEMPHARGHAQPCEARLQKPPSPISRRPPGSSRLSSSRQRKNARLPIRRKPGGNSTSGSPVRGTHGRRRLHASAQHDTPQSTAARKGLGADLDAVGRDLVLVLRDGNGSQAATRRPRRLRARARRRLCNQLPKTDFPEATCKAGCSQTHPVPPKSSPRRW